MRAVLQRKERWKQNDMKQKNMESKNIEYVVSAYSDLLYRMGIMLLKNRQDAEDAVQEVLIKYMKKAPPLSTASMRRRG